MHNTKLLITTLCVSLLGFFDATYLTIEHYRNAFPPCTINGCETVLSSKYASVYGIPVSLGGVLFYLAVALLVALALQFRASWMVQCLRALLPLGFLASLYLVFLQLFVLHAICLYCMGSALTSTALFVCWLVLLRSRATPQQSIPQ